MRKAIIGALAAGIICAPVAGMVAMGVPVPAAVRLGWIMFSSVAGAAVGEKF